VLILGHSFVRRLQSDLKARFDERAAIDFDLQGTADIYMHGVGGRTVPKLRKFDLGLIAKISPEIVILEIGTNDLVNTPPEVVGSYIEDMVRHLISHYSVRAVVLCHVTPRMTHQSSKFNEKATLLNQYTQVVLEPIQQAICWKHRGFSNPSITPFLPDGVHFNPMGQYTLYRSYRGAIKHALNVLKHERQG
jgi:lysophospholipase L1-like esterase